MTRNVWHNRMATGKAQIRIISRGASKPEIDVAEEVMQARDTQTLLTRAGVR